MTDSTPTANPSYPYDTLSCPHCGAMVKVHIGDGDGCIYLCLECQQRFAAGQARKKNDSTPSAAPSKPNPAGPDPETIRNYARPAFYLSYERRDDDDGPEFVWTVRSEPERETIGEILELSSMPSSLYAAYVVYGNLEPRIGRFPDLWSAAQAIHNVSQHVI